MAQLLRTRLIIKNIKKTEMEDYLSVPFAVEMHYDQGSSYKENI